ncbi:SDR family oxidoreductase [Lactovum miscens]|uniref:NAD(P)-dependent dehydrogenase (Short-subunit alcohol dehydrogenase family) n=1 Tax=Lactovum miscens TaxID=190387 RepID=A0A841C9C6_9LACT|nr:SDR family oxidoreductase [Lactovum miscens]MBB5888328.1 NAD(P)-dependent dehydrogenase (short-subunit alcohol dehydrogenase family) [Lactovum miscens]
MEKQVIIITGASSGFGALTARALAKTGHIVYAGMRNTLTRNANRVAEVEQFAKDNKVSISAIEMDVSSQESVNEAISRIEVEQSNGIDIVIHNAGHMVTGALEAFTPEQLGELYDINVLSAQRVNKAVLPAMRSRKQGLIIWVSSSSVKGGTPPYLGPYFAAKAGMDSIAVSYAAELSQFGIETSIVVPGSFTNGTNHFANSGYPDNKEVQKIYDQKYPNLMENVSLKLAGLFPDGADVSLVSDEIVRIVNLPKGKRPYRTHIDPADDGSEAVSNVADGTRSNFLKRIGLEYLLSVKK